jgi:hypothetical protein
MVSNPKPQQAFWNPDGKRSVVEAHSDGSVFANLLEVEGWMTRVCLQ